MAFAPGRQAPHRIPRGAPVPKNRTFENSRLPVGFWGPLRAARRSLAWPFEIPPRAHPHVGGRFTEPNSAGNTGPIGADRSPGFG